jgi:hypothetical protein
MYAYRDLDRPEQEDSFALLREEKVREKNIAVRARALSGFLSDTMGMNEFDNREELMTRMNGWDPLGDQNAWCTQYFRVALEKSGVVPVGILSPQALGVKNSDLFHHLDASGQIKAGHMVHINWGVNSFGNPAGHTAFITGIIRDDAGAIQTLLLAGGNQSNTVSVAAYDYVRLQDQMTFLELKNPDMQAAVNKGVADFTKNYFSQERDIPDNHGEQFANYSPDRGLRSYGMSI